MTFHKSGYIVYVIVVAGAVYSRYIFVYLRYYFFCMVKSRRGISRRPYVAETLFVGRRHRHDGNVGVYVADIVLKTA